MTWPSYSCGRARPLNTKTKKYSSGSLMNIITPESRFLTSYHFPTGPTNLHRFFFTAFRQGWLSAPHCGSFTVHRTRRGMLRYRSGRRWINNNKSLFSSGVAHIYRYLRMPKDIWRCLFVFQAWATPFKSNNILIGFRFWIDREEGVSSLLLSLDLLLEYGKRTLLITSPFQQLNEEICQNRVLISTRYFSIYLHF